MGDFIPQCQLLFVVPKRRQSFIVSNPTTIICASEGCFISVHGFDVTVSGAGALLLHTFIPTENAQSVMDLLTGCGLEHRVLDARSAFRFVALASPKEVTPVSVLAVPLSVPPVHVSTLHIPLISLKALIQSTPFFSVF